MKSLSSVRLLATPQTIAPQAPLSMGFSRPEYWSGMPFLSPGDLPNPGIEPGSPTLQADSLQYEPLGKPTKCTSMMIFPLSERSLFYMYHPTLSESSLGIWSMSCLNPQPQGFQVINKYVLNGMNMAIDEQNLICILYLSHIIEQFI